LRCAQAEPVTLRTDVDGGGDRVGLLRVLLALADEGEELSERHLPAEYRHTPALPLRERHDERLISETLQRYDGNISKAAQALGVARSTLYRRAARDKGD
ncbi:helix-turn-helix domain-containing protein, partial [Serratia rubidaea]|uniref:helix-turn-helix domain-containing protein n=1 Tax=Serratia rubidaea TaxID=61652 RepID=UPI001BBE5FCC